MDFALIKRYVHEHHPDYTVVILAKELHNPLAYIPHMAKQIALIATSKAVVLDSYCIAASLLAGHVKAPVIQIWHAMGNMKRFGYTSFGEEEGRSEETAQLMNMHKGYDSVHISAMSFVEDFAAGMNVDPAIMYEAPLPKADLLVDPTIRATRRAAICEAYPQLKEKKNIVYAPTFRRNESPETQQAMDALLNAVDFSRYNFIYKAHPVSTQRFNDPRVLQDYPRAFDMLYVADYVISDYSTVIYEAGLLDVPVYLYAYDWSTYSGKRSLYIDLEHDVPTLFTADATLIIDAIEHDRFDAEAYRAFVRRNIAIPADESCTARTVRHMFQLMEEKGR